MSVPRPAMLVATVTRPGWPAWGDDLGFDLVVLGVQDLVLDVRRSEQGAELFRLLDRPGADQDRYLRLVPGDDLVGNGLKLFALGGEDPVGDPRAGVPCGWSGP